MSDISTDLKFYSCCINFQFQIKSLGGENVFIQPDKDKLMDIVDEVILLTKGIICHGPGK